MAPKDDVLRPWNGTAGEWFHLAARMRYNATRLPAKRWEAERAAMIGAAEDAQAAYKVAARANRRNSLFDVEWRIAAIQRTARERGHITDEEQAELDNLADVQIALRNKDARQ